MPDTFVGGDVTDFLLPSLGADMEVGTIVEWRIGPGDEVRRGQVVAVVSTDKSDLDVECWQDGIVEELLVEPGVEISVGTPVARLRTGGAEGAAAAVPEPAAVPEAEPAAVPEAEPAAVPEAEPAAVPEPAHRVRSPLVRHLVEEKHLDVEQVHASGPAGLVHRADVEEAAGSPTTAAVPPPRARGRSASPLARRRASELGVDLAGVTPTMPSGAISVVDVERAAAGPAQAPAVVAPRVRPGPGPAGPKRSPQQAVGALMARSKREIPHYYAATDIDMKAALSWLAEANATRSVKERLLPAVLVAKAVARAAAEFPVVNGWYEGDAHVPSETVDLGLAVALRGGGLIAPTIPRASQLPVDALMPALLGLVNRARKGALTSSDVVKASITLTNLGDQGVPVVYGVIVPPQVALVGAGKVTERPWAVDGMLTVRPILTLTLSGDHRVGNGHEGARFLAAVDLLLQRPDEL